MSLRRVGLVSAIAVAAVTAGYSIGRAGSPYPAGANPPVNFSGYLSSSGAPLSGSHQIAMNLWRANDTSTPTNQVCAGSTQTVSVTDGHFQLPLDEGCVDMFSRYTLIWYQLVVDGTPFPLEQVGSVPFAARSAREPSSGSRLVQTRSVLYGEDGYRGSMVDGPIHDSLRNENCVPLDTSEGKRCLPAAAGLYGETATPAGALSTWFKDSSCTQTYPQSGYTYFINGYNPYSYVVDNPGPITAIYPATVVSVTSPYQSLYPGSCQPYPNQYTIYQYALGPAVPLTEFVQMQQVTE